MSLSFAITVMLGWTIVGVPVALAAGRALKAMEDRAITERAVHAEQLTRLVDAQRGQIDRVLDVGRLEREALLRNMIVLSGATQAANLSRVIQAEAKAHTPPDLGQYMENLLRTDIDHAHDDDGLPRGATLVGMGD